jgi:hypothetical protein
MAMTKTRTVQRVEVYPGNPDPRLMVVYEVSIDDPDDDALPVTATKVENFNRVNDMDPDNPSTEPTDMSGEDPLVQTIAAAVWAD